LIEDGLKIAEVEWSDAAWSPNNKQLIAVLSNGKAYLWTLSSSNILPIGDESVPYTSAAWDWNSTHIVLGGNDGTISIINTKSHQQPKALKGHMSRIWSISFSNDGKRLLTTDNSGVSIVWDTSRYEVITTLRAHQGSVLTGRLNAVGSTAITGGDDGIARIWDVRTGRLLRSLRAAQANIGQAYWIRGASEVIVATADGVLRTWLVDDNLIVVDIDRRLCNIFTDEEILSDIPSWPGCTTVLAKSAAMIAEFDRLELLAGN
jgi:WD40 repeat protein